MINEDNLNIYGQGFDYDTQTVYVKMNGEVKDYKLTEKQFKDLHEYFYFELTPEISLEKLSDVCEKLVGDKNYDVGMAWTGLSYDYDAEKGLGTINIDLGDKINSYTIPKEDYFGVVEAAIEDPIGESLLPLEEFDDKLRKFTAGEISIDSFNVAGRKMGTNNLNRDDALAVIADESEMAVDSLGQLMWPEKR